MASPIRIPVYQPELGAREKAFVLECLDTGWISSKGRFVGEFEQAFAKFLRAGDAVSACNGTVALHLALLALGLGPGDEVIVPTLTYVASVNAIAYTGATPVFVDSSPAGWNLDLAEVRRRITPRTRVIMAVHLYGLPCDLDALAALCTEHHLHLVEDCAESFGARIGDRHTGTYGVVSAFSFFGNKTITTGEGGMVVTADPAIAARLRHFRGQGLAANREYWHDLVGYNYRMTNICAALGLGQLERADAVVARKRRLADTYRTALAGLPLEFQHEPPGITHSQWMVTALTPDAARRDALRAQLAADGIETRPVFHPVHTMPIYPRPGETFPVAVDVASRGLNLPSWPALLDGGVEDVCARVRSFFDA